MALYTVLVRATENYKHKGEWHKLMLRGMTADFSWDASARKYVDFYYRPLATKGREHRLEEYEFTKRS